MDLVIVESSAKAKTINEYLGKNYKVIASFGHVRDLPSKNGSVLPEENFAVKYEIPAKAQKYVDVILNEASKAKIIYLATDPDREGESISWHIAAIIKANDSTKKDSDFKRIIFNQITKQAIIDSIKNPRNIDINLVDAQQARRALDYIFGFSISPILWRKLPGCLSAGRVQSCALSLISEREDEIERFKSEEYWDISVQMLNLQKKNFLAKLTHINDLKLEKFSIFNEKQANELVLQLSQESFFIHSIEKKQQKRQPAPPFITSSLQQEASYKLGFTAKKTMQIAQKLYEGVNIGNETRGLITYMRTDGVTLADEALTEIREFIKIEYGEKYLPKEARIYKTKVKNAQEAHEAIRPTDINLTPVKLINILESDQYKLYDLIWKRTIACQMENMILNSISAILRTNNNNFSAKANGSSIEFEGFYKIYHDTSDHEAANEKMLPKLTELEEVKIDKLLPAQHFTEAPPRYNEASLVKKMEELGIGRPSTYVPIISVLQDRKYVRFDKKRFFPEERGRLVTTFLKGFFKQYVEYDFTASLENELDDVAAGRLDWKELLRNFWKDFNDNIELVSQQKITEILDYLEQELDYHLFGEESESNKKRNCGSCDNGKLKLKLGKFGAFLACDNYPECNFKKQIHDNKSSNASHEEDKILGQDDNGVDIYLKKGPFGFYVQYGNVSTNIVVENTEEIVPEITNLVKKTKKTRVKKIPISKPKRASLPLSLIPENITIEKALTLLNLPFSICNHPVNQEEILVNNGRFGPYLKYGDKFVRIPKEYDFLSLTKDQAILLVSNYEKRIEAKNNVTTKIITQNKNK
jgi:DNA topoisomerase-1